jgi:hypothetical protein
MQALLGSYNDPQCSYAREPVVRYPRYTYPATLPARQSWTHPVVYRDASGEYPEVSQSSFWGWHVPSENSGLRERFLDLLGNAYIREEHELFDQTVCFAQLLLLNIYWVGGLCTIQMNLDFWRCQVKRPGGHAASFQLLREGVEKANAVCQLVLLVSMLTH